VTPPAAVEKPVQAEEPKLQQVFTKQEYLEDAPARKEEIKPVAKPDTPPVEKPEAIASATSDEQTT